MDGVLSSPAPLWATVLLVLLAFVSGRWFRRAKLVEERTARRAAEREARYATRRAESAEQAADAATRALPTQEWPEPVCQTLTTRGGAVAEELADPEFAVAYERAQQIEAETGAELRRDAVALREDFRRAAADFPALSPDARAEERQETTQALADLRRTDQLVEASSLGTPEAAELRQSVSARGALTGVPEEQADWDEGDPYDVEPEPDEDLPEDPARVTRFAASILPRYGWSPVSLPSGYGVMPDSRLRDAARVLARAVRRRRLAGSALAVGSAVAGGWRSWLARAAERAEAGRLESGWKPGQITTLVTGRLSTGESHDLLRRWLHRRPRRAVRPLAWLRRLRRRERIGRHRPEVAPGALAQRQTRLLALPAGAL